MASDELTVTTEPDLAAGGDAVARVGGLVVFVRGGAPSETLRVAVTPWKKGFARAEILEIVKPSSDRRDARCRHFGECGGCQWQHITYDAQLRAKESIVRAALAKRFGPESPPFVVHASPIEYEYRSRARVHVVRPHRGFLVGFRRARSRLVHDVDACPVLTPAAGALFAALRGAPLRETGELDLCAGERGGSVAPRVAGLPAGDYECEVDGIRYRTSAETFFQANEALVSTLRDTVVRGESGALAIDLFCGSGFFSLPLARRFDRVVGVESSAAAVALGTAAAADNGIQNVELNSFDVVPWLDGFRLKCAQAATDRPELVVLDPPRTGAKQVLDLLREVGPARITYVSCDPGTLGRDLRAVDGAYRIERVDVLDMFPQTSHVETVVRLARIHG